MKDDWKILRLFHPGAGKGKDSGLHFPHLYALKIPVSSGIDQKFSLFKPAIKHFVAQTGHDVDTARKAHYAAVDQFGKSPHFQVKTSH